MRNFPSADPEAIRGGVATHRLRFLKALRVHIDHFGHCGLGFLIRWKRQILAALSFDKLLHEFIPVPTTFVTITRLVSEN
jgi:hypothetical protein